MDGRKKFLTHITTVLCRKTCTQAWRSDVSFAFITRNIRPQISGHVCLSFSVTTKIVWKNFKDFGVEHHVTSFTLLVSFLLVEFIFLETSRQCGDQNMESTS
jgi:hypothetical protein